MSKRRSGGQSGVIVNNISHNVVQYVAAKIAKTEHNSYAILIIKQLMFQ